MLTIEELRRFLSHIYDCKADPATKIRFAETIRRAINTRPGTAEELGLTPEAISRLPKF